MHREKLIFTEYSQHLERTCMPVRSWVEFELFFLQNIGQSLIKSEHFMLISSNFLHSLCKHFFSHCIQHSKDADADPKKKKNGADIWTVSCLCTIKMQCKRSFYIVQFRTETNNWLLTHVNCKYGVYKHFININYECRFINFNVVIFKTNTIQI